jgi:putative transcriptional regulator
MDLKHQFLIAMPGLDGSTFGGTLSYLCEHNDEGAFALVVNQPLEGVTLGAIFDQLSIAGTAHRDVPVLDGGPVQRDRGFVLHSDDCCLPATVKLQPGLALSTVREMLTAIAEGSGPTQFLVCLGYAGWGEGQLEQEMAENAWLSCPGDFETLFEAPFEARRQRAAESLGIDLALFPGAPGHG